MSRIAIRAHPRPSDGEGRADRPGGVVMLFSSRRSNFRAHESALFGFLAV